MKKNNSILCCHCEAFGLLRIKIRSAEAIPLHSLGQLEISISPIWVDGIAAPVREESSSYWQGLAMTGLGRFF